VIPPSKCRRVSSQGTSGSVTRTGSYDTRYMRLIWEDALHGEHTWWRTEIRTWARTDQSTDKPRRRRAEDFLRALDINARGMLRIERYGRLAMGIVLRYFNLTPIHSSSQNLYFQGRIVDIVRGAPIACSVYLSPMLKVTKGGAAWIRIGVCGDDSRCPRSVFDLSRVLRLMTPLFDRPDSEFQRQRESDCSLRAQDRLALCSEAPTAPICRKRPELRGRQGDRPGLSTWCQVVKVTERAGKILSIGCTSCRVTSLWKKVTSAVKVSLYETRWNLRWIMSRLWWQ
jgi:hypothetical protein